ncbi:MAG TPA: DUF456 domain-containing protein [Firmicutes bacterium]|jgi:uncharacterized protein YqgC (DUF456 family)|nr:DUF456 domain-containing protein [Bacillota bacterium]HAA37275.1 DUF456 domain-containing protein [Bacillota bacterium]
MPYLPLLLASLMFIVGFLGTFLPVLPGAILIYGGMLLYGYLTKFTALTIHFFIIEGLALLLVFAVDFLAAAVGTKRYGGSRAASFGAAVGTLAGIFFFPPLGIIVGPFVGAALAELIKGKEIDQALRVGFGTIIGLLGGTILKIVIETAMIIYFFITIF